MSWHMYSESWSAPRSFGALVARLLVSEDKIIRFLAMSHKNAGHCAVACGLEVFRITSKTELLT